MMLRNFLIFLMLAPAAWGSTLIHFQFDGNYLGSSFVPPPPPLNQVTFGQYFTLGFDVDISTAPATVMNIVASFPALNITLAPNATTIWTYNALSSLYEYRWDIDYPLDSRYMMNFWFRTATPNVVVAGVPLTLDSTKFLEHSFSVYLKLPGGGGSGAISVPLNTVVTPEPGSMALLGGALGVLLIRRRR